MIGNNSGEIRAAAPEPTNAAPATTKLISTARELRKEMLDGDGPDSGGVMGACTGADGGGAERRSMSS